MAHAAGLQVAGNRAEPQVIDLCGDDDDSPSPGVARFPSPVARLPLPSDHEFETIILDDDDDDDIPESARRRRRRQHGKKNELKNERTVSSPDKKPAARKRADLEHGATGAAAIAATPTALTWPAQTLTVNKSTRHIVDLSMSTATAAPAAFTPPATAPRTPLDSIVEVFPDVDRNHAETLLRLQGDPSLVLSILAESKYPTEKRTPASIPSDGITLHREKRKRIYQYDFSSPSCFVPTAEYTTQAQHLLIQVFPFISLPGSRKLLAQVGLGHYAVCHEAICRAIMGGPLAKDEDQQEEQYRLLKSALSSVPLTQEQHTRLMVGSRRMTVLHPRRQAHVAHTTDAILLEEMDFVRQKQKEWMGEIRLRLARKQKRADAEKAGATMECPCCCFDVAVDEMIACREEGHLFCVDCLRRFAENQIFTNSSFGVDRKTGKPATDLLCMHSDGCSSGFDVAHLRKALPDNVMAKYEELQYQAAVDAAGLELL